MPWFGLQCVIVVFPDPTHFLLSVTSESMWKYVQEVLVNRLVMFAQEKRVVWWSDSLNMTIAIDWDVKPQTNKKKKTSLASWWFNWNINFIGFLKAEKIHLQICFYALFLCFYA